MGSSDYFKPGSFNRICDRTGFKVKAEETEKEWTGSIVRRKSWEPRHPQDFVRGKEDRQSVPNARPRKTDVYVGPLVTKIATQAEPGDNVLALEDNSRFAAADILQIYYKEGDMKRVVVQSVDADNEVTLTTSLGGTLEVGSAVVNLTAVSTASVDS